MNDLLEFLDRYCVSLQIQPVAPYGRNKNRVLLRFFNPTSQETDLLGAPSVAAAAWRARCRVSQQLATAEIDATSQAQKGTF
jgi:hypothetical protein